MIKRYSDHAANERTFLAWVRTAIAVMAFGFVIERFDLFLKVAALQTGQAHLVVRGQSVANIAGLVFIVLGVAMVAIAAIRFRKTAKEIDADETVPGLGEGSDLALSVLVGLLGLSLFLYLAHAVVPAL
jgi:putative membrane protein